jgi:GTP-binding protein EngB required for normal cell division
MNISVDLANRDLTEADVTEVDQEFIDALVEIEGQKEFSCTKCDKICKSKGGLTHQDIATQNIEAKVLIRVHV